MKARKNPLNKRIPRQLKEDFGKYIVIFIMLFASISLVSGYLVAADSMILAYNNSFEKYNIEDGHFQIENKANQAQINRIEEYGVTVYENFYVESETDYGASMRVYPNRTEVDTVCLMEGQMPETAEEIAIDRMHADNNQLTVGDVISIGDISYTITGLVALPDYSALFQSNGDSMFDAIKFGVAIVNKEGFDRLDEDNYTWNYAWKYDTPPQNDTEANDLSEDFMSYLYDQVKLKDYVPEYQNQAIIYSGEDLGSDRAMMVVFLYIIVVIMAFVFAITITNTITKDAAVIGTLLASGYTRKELVLHYMKLPLYVTLAGAALGNVLGYSVLKSFCVSMYYGSYSLPTYVTVWNASAFVETTIVPFVMMLVINYLILTRTLKISPLKFLRRDLSRKKNRKAIPLSYHLPFFHRFRLRVIFQNMTSYLLLLVGILFANMLLIFGLALPACLEHYQATIGDNMMAPYQYLLNVPMELTQEDGDKLEMLATFAQFSNAVETDNETAEKFSVYQLMTVDPDFKSEEVLLYGLEDDSKYINLDVSGSNVYVSSAYADKYQLQVGDTILLKEQYEKDTYQFVITGIYDYAGALDVYMSRENLNRTLDLSEDWFGGYFSETEITDIEEQYISSTIDYEALTKISRQLMKSMGSFMYLVDVFAVAIFVVLIYLLSKIIIEKNAQSISMAKVLGYTSGEIGRLYILSTSIVCIAAILVSLPIEDNIMRFLFRYLMTVEMSGWIEYWLDPKIFPEMFALGAGTYFVVVLLEMHKIKRIPMDEALKNVE